MRNGLVISQDTLSTVSENKDYTSHFSDRRMALSKNLLGKRLSQLQARSYLQFRVKRFKV